jgi:16S rRNA (adenine1518-N6/adenine1519-N6)-dimethyltransferase
MIGAIAPGPDDVFLEIGPGRGGLTLPLAAIARLVIGIEVDRDLAAYLPTIAPPNVRVVISDVLDVDLAAVLAPAGEAARIRVAGNLPYNISSPILFRLLDMRAVNSRLADATLMLQKEVADRLLATPGTSDYGVLSVLVGRRTRITHLLTLPPGAFRPPPKVTSAVVRLEFLADEDVTPVAPNFDATVRALFMRRRKTMSNALASSGRLEPRVAAELLAGLGIDPRRRPETLSIADFAAVAQALAGGAEGRE